MDIVLPSWDIPHTTYPTRQSSEDIAWAQQVAITNAMVNATKASEAKHAQRYSPDWLDAQKLEQERQRSDDEKREAELREEAATRQAEYYKAISENERKHALGE